MLRFLLEVLAFALADAAWWRLTDRRLRTLRRPAPWRMLLGAFMVGQLAYLLMYVSVALIDNFHEFGPLAWRAEAYLWHIIVLPITLGIAMLTQTIRWMGRLHTGVARRRSDKSSNPATPSAERQYSRRDALAAGGVALPVMATALLGVQALHTMGDFRIRRATLRIPSLPPDLDGLTILQLSDLHIGRFLPAGLPQRVAAAANALPADLVVFTGDLFDVSAKDRAPGIDFIRSLNPRHGLVMIQGNHDGMSNADWFEGPIRDAGLPLLQDESRVFELPGRATPVQLLGINWGERVLGSALGRMGRDARRHFRVYSDEATEASLHLLVSQRKREAFPILLAHHPHVFDPAAALGFPLTLSGHTHGGQLMLNDHVGVGPARFRYWTGPYAKADARLFVSNGLGSWFPLRVNAPEEISHLTLRRA